MRYITFSLLLLISSSLFAAGSKELVKITNDTDTLVAFMNILTDDNNEIAGYEYVKFRDNVLIESKKFPAILDYDGFVLERARNRDVIILRGVNVSEVIGGELQIDFLFNAFNGARGQFAVELNTIEGKWQISKDGKTIKHLHLIANKKPGLGVVGIKQVLIKE